MATDNRKSFIFGIFANDQNGDGGRESLWAPNGFDPEHERLILAAPQSTFNWLTGFGTGIQLSEKRSNDEHRKTRHKDRVDRSKDPTYRAKGVPELMLQVTVISAIDAMLASYYIDEKNGVNYELCKRSDCQNVFVVKSNHGQKFCSQKCAHLVSVRNSRLLAKKPAKESEETQ